MTLKKKISQLKKKTNNTISVKGETEMLYNKETQKVQQATDCLSCPYFDKRKKKCLGIDKNCFGYDPKTKTAFNTKTKMPIRFN